MTSGAPRGAIAAIDCGTNSTRLLVVDDSGVATAREMRITRLGEGVDATGKLAPEAIARTVAVLNDYRKVMDALDVRRARVVATSATRDASNSEEFFDAAERATGFRPELLSGMAEGRLSFEGATVHLPSRFRDAGTLLVADIGGGSTELIAGPPHQARSGSALHAPGEITEVSLDIGCVRISERFFQHDPPSSAELQTAREFVGALLRESRERLPELPAGGIVIGLAGTVSTLASLEVGASRYDRTLVHHALLSREKVARWLGTLAGESASQRLSHRGMVRGREDVIVGGVLVLDELMKVFDRSACLASEDDILDGLAMSLRDTTP